MRQSICLLAVVSALLCPAVRAQGPTGGPGDGIDGLRTGEAQVIRSLALDDATVARLREHDLLVLGQERQTSLFDCYHGLESDGCPVYITADAMLYLWYEAHREALMAIEKQWLLPQTRDLATRLLASTRRLRAEADDSLLASNEVMLRVVCNLLDGGPVEPPEAEVSAEVARVLEHTSVEAYPGEDYTQYTVRGHYTGDETLSRYFRGTKYLARRYFRVADPMDPEAADRELRRGLYLALALRTDSGLPELYRQIADTRVFLSGPADTIGLDQLSQAAEVVWGESWSPAQLADLSGIRRELADPRYPRTRINTRINDGTPLPRWNVACLGEHYLPDAELFHRTTDPTVPGRPLPSGLDLATALGSGLAGDELAASAGSPQVVANARAFSEEMKLEGVYGSWMATLRSLFEDPEGDVPPFARGEAYGRKQLNCCLTSWAQLRHNYILYGTQSYSGGGSGPVPHAGIVEPLPAFFSAYSRMCAELADRVERLQTGDKPLRALRFLEAKGHIFRRCAEDQLAGRDTAWAAHEIRCFGSFIGQVYFGTPLIVADVATDSSGRGVLHAGSGPFHRILVRYSVGGEPTIAQGWVGSYYEFAEPGMARLTDEQWTERCQSSFSRPTPPSWLAAIYDMPPALGATTEELRQIEQLLLQGEQEAAMQAAQAFIDRDPYGELAPVAAVLVGRYLISKGHYAEAEAFLKPARRMYGGDARDEALRMLDSCGWVITGRKRDADAQARFEAELGATDPQPGLPEDEELERQHSRALLLIDRASYLRWWSGGSREMLARVLSECPRSGCVPYAELVLALPLTEGNARREMLPPSNEALRTARERLLEVGRKYEGSAIGRVARVEAIGMASRRGDFDTAYEEFRSLPTPPEDEPYPRSVALLTRREAPVPENLFVDSGSVAIGLVEAFLPAACGAGDLPRVRELLAVAGTHSPGYPGGPCGDVLMYLEYLGDEPEALAALLPLLTPVEVDDDGAPASAALTAEARAEVAQRIVTNYPGSKAAPAALYLAWSRSRRYDVEEQSPVCDGLARLLAERYSRSIEHLCVAYRTAVDARDLAAARRCAEPLRSFAVEPDDDDPVSVYRMSLLEACPSTWPFEAMPHELAEWKERFAEFIRDAELTDEQLQECAGTPELVALLIERLPHRAVAIVLAADAESIGRHFIDRLLAAHPDDPQAHELRLRVGGLEHLAAIIAAGPNVPQFEEAVENFVASAPPEYRELAGSLYDYRVLSRRHEGTPAETLALAGMVGVYARHDRPEEGVRLADEALARLAPDRLFRDRLQAERDGAQQRVVAKRTEVADPTWRVTEAWSAPGLDPLRIADGQDVVYVAGVGPDGDPGVAALAKETGEVVWAARTGVVSSLLRVGERLLYTTRHGSVGCLAADGSPLWDTALGVAEVGAASVCMTTAGLVALWDQGCLFGLDLGTGRILWQRDLLAGAKDDEDGPPARYVALTDRLLLVRDTGGVLHAWTPDGSRRLWSGPEEEASDDDDDDPILLCEDVVIARVISDYPDTHYVGLSAEDGRLLWKVQFGEGLGDYQDLGQGPPVLVSDASIAELDPADGKLRWSLPIASEQIFEVASSPRYLAFVQSQTATVVERQSGQVAATVPVPDDLVRKVFGESKGQLRLYVAGEQGLEAYDLPLPAE